MRRVGTFAIVLAVAVSACRGHDASTKTATTAPAGNPVQVEMQLLSAAMEAAVRSIGVGDVREVGHALHGVHEAKQATAAALESGAYRTPKNGDDVARFRELDEAFHRHLERIVVASHANDVAGTAEAVGRALTACDGCHRQFRQ